MYITEKKKVTKYLERVVKTKCDICQKEIPNFDETRDLRKSRYFEVTTGHHLWGNDSIDSIRDYNICPDCIQKFIKNYIENVENTYYIDIETTVASEEKYSDEEYEEGE